MTSHSSETSLLTRSLIKFLEEVEDLKLWPIGIACSGGRDSMLLVDLCIEFCPPRYLDRLYVFSVDHGLYPSSTDNAQLTCEYWEKRGIHAEVLTASKELIARGKGVEDGAREARYQVLLDAADHHDVKIICTAHHAGDQAETLLMRLHGPSGLGGLSGIPSRRERFYRPWLQVNPELIAEEHQARGLPLFPDPTNQDERFLRNAVRAHISPSLEHVFGKQWAERVSETASFLTEDWETLNYFVRAKLEQHLISLPSLGRILLKWDEGLSSPRSVMRTLLRITYQKALYRLAPTECDLRRTSAQLDLLEEVFLGAHHQLRSLPLGLLVWGGRGQLHLINPSFFAPLPSIPLTVSEDDLAKVIKITWGEWCLTISPCELNEAYSGCHLLRASFPLQLISPPEGARYRPCGSSGSKRVHRMWSDRRVPVYERPRLPILCDAQGEVLWAPHCLPAYHLTDSLSSTQSTWRIEWGFVYPNENDPNAMEPEDRASFGAID